MCKCFLYLEDPQPLLLSFSQHATPKAEVTQCRANNDHYRGIQGARPRTKALKYHCVNCINITFTNYFFKVQLHICTVRAIVSLGSFRGVMVKIMAPLKSFHSYKVTYCNIVQDMYRPPRTNIYQYLHIPL